MKYTDESKEKLKEEFKSQFKKLLPTQQNVLFVKFSEILAREEKDKNIISPESIIGKENKANQFSALLDKFLDSEKDSENDIVSERLKKLNGANYGPGLQEIGKSMNASIGTFFEEAKKEAKKVEEKQEPKKEAVVENDAQRGNDLLGAENNNDENQPIEKNRKEEMGQNIAQNPVKEVVQKREKEDYISNLREFFEMAEGNVGQNKKEQDVKKEDEIVVFGNGGGVNQKQIPEQGVGNLGNNQNPKEAQEEDLYSKIMNINLNRASILDEKLLAKDKDFNGERYEKLSDEEKSFSRAKLAELSKYSSDGINSFDELNTDKGQHKLASLKEFDESANDKSFNKLSESIPFKSADYKLENNTKISEIKSPDGNLVGSLEKTKREIDIGGKKVDVWQAKLNLDDRSEGFDVAAKLYLYDETGKQSDLSIIIGKDKNGIPLISAQHDIEKGRGDDLVKLKRDGKTYVMPITYNDYEQYHKKMLDKGKFNDLDLSKNMEKPQQPKGKDKDQIDISGIDLSKLKSDNSGKSNISSVVAMNPNAKKERNNSI